jgi:hypothetical protein
MLIWKWMIQNTYLPSYLSWRWMDLPPTIMILYVSPNCYYVSPNVHKHQTMESRQISNTYLPRMSSHTSFALEVSHHGKMCQMNVSSLSFVIVLMAIDISMSHAKNWKKACPIRDNITMLLHIFLFWSYFKWVKFWATLQDWVMSWIHHQVILWHSNSCNWVFC